MAPKALVSLMYRRIADMMSRRQAGLLSAASVAATGTNARAKTVQLPAPRGMFRGAVNKQALAKAMQLESDRFVTFAQTVGYPKHST